MKRYRRIEVNAYRGRVTILSGESPRKMFDASLPQNDGASLNQSEVGEAIEPDSPEGQLILVEAVRSLEQRLSPETRATVYADQQTRAPKSSKRNDFCLKLQSLYDRVCAQTLRFDRKKQ